MSRARTRTISPAQATSAAGGPVGYPVELRDAERVLLARRRAGVRPGPAPDGAAPDGAAPDVAPDSVVGVGVSGGGIRSATFALGFFQALARARLLRHVDYLSTVSGGGYFGGFLGRLIGRVDVADVADAERVLTGAHPTIGGRVVETLRENGRYLSPNGSGDLLMGGAVLFRNWLALHVVLASAVLAAFGLLQTLRLAAVGFARAPAEAFELPASAVWWSPWLWLPAACFGLVCVPLGWAYWFVESRIRWQLLGLLCVLGAAGVSAAVRLAAGGHLAVELGVGLSVVLAQLMWGAAMRRAREGDEDGGGTEATRGRARTLLSRRLATALTAFAVLLAVGLVDTAGGTLVRRAVIEGTSPFGAWWGAIGAAFLGLSAFGRQIVVAIGGVAGATRLRLGASTLAGVVAFAVCGALLIAADMVSHQLAAVSVRGAAYVGIPSAPERAASTRRIVLDGPTAADRATLEVACDEGRGAAAPAGGAAVRGRHVLPSAVATLFLVALSWVFGRTWAFLNRSSHHSLYSARIGRAYLGASSPRRWRDGVAVTELLRGDDLPLADYFAAEPRGDGEGGAIAKGGPLHLVNVTINETTEGTSNVAQQDRRGTTLAVGPAGLSVGVADHAVLDWRHPRQASAVLPAEAADRSLRAFGDGLDQASGPDVRPLSEWLGVSGAAFSTGLGARTSLGTSLLCGLANVRLGHWWWSGVRRTSDAAARRQRGRWWRRAFGVQAYLFDELTAQFPGTARYRWYLSDGGHFENMGGYELIRRQHRRILIVDGEADPTYTFEGLANLVRKARIDFGAEIRFLDSAELGARVAPEHLPALGRLDALARAGKPGAPDPTAARQQPSLSHAALGQVRYRDGTTGWILYVKTTVRGDEPLDVLRYQSAQPDFPQETTADQFFDEAQWESYRRLGQHIGEVLFGRDAPSVAPPDAIEQDGPSRRPWHPRDLFVGDLPAAVDPDPSIPPTAP